MNEREVQRLARVLAGHFYGRDEAFNVVHKLASMEPNIKFDEAFRKLTFGLGPGKSHLSGMQNYQIKPRGKQIAIAKGGRRKRW